MASRYCKMDTWISSLIAIRNTMINLTIRYERVIKVSYSMQLVANYLLSQQSKAYQFASGKRRFAVITNWHQLQSVAKLHELIYFSSQKAGWLQNWRLPRVHEVRYRSHNWRWRDVTIWSRGTGQLESFNTQQSTLQLHSMEPQSDLGGRILDPLLCVDASSSTHLFHWGEFGRRFKMTIFTKSFQVF